MAWICADPSPQYPVTSAVWPAASLVIHASQLLQCNQCLSYMEFLAFLVSSCFLSSTSMSFLRLFSSPSMCTLKPLPHCQAKCHARAQLPERRARRGRKGTTAWPQMGGFMPLYSQWRAVETWETNICQHPNKGSSCCHSLAGSRARHRK